MIIKLFLCALVLWLCGAGIIATWKYLEEYSQRDLKRIYRETKKKLSESHV